MPDTREKLLEAAERLFATRGIDGATVREVNELAGQRNTSAIRYHFDGMSGLLAALVEMRMSELDAARQTAFEAARSEAADVEDYVAVLVLPLVERVHADASWSCWIRVLAQLVSVRGDEHRPLWEGRFDRATRRVFGEIRTRLPEIPPRVWRQRVDDMMLLSIGSLCERVRRLEAGGPAGLGTASYGRNLVNTASAVLRAPL